MSVELEWCENVARILLGYGKGEEAETSYLLISPEKEIIIIDTGASPLAGKKILKIIEEDLGMGRTAADVSKIILTHTHPDHIGGLAYLAKKTNAEILVHEDGYKVFKEGTAFVTSNQFPYVSKFGLAMKSSILGNYKVLRGLIDRVRVIKGDETQTLDIEEDTLLFRRTGGHSADSILIHAYKKAATFIGDEGYIYDNNSYSFYFDATGSLRRRTKSLEVFSRLKTNVFFTAHTKPVTKNEFPEFTATQELAVEHLNNMLAQVMLDVGKAKLPYIAPAWENMVGIAWDSPFKELNVSYTTAQILLEKMIEEGNVKYKPEKEDTKKKKKKKDKKKKKKKKKDKDEEEEELEEKDEEIEEDEELQEEEEGAKLETSRRKTGYWEWTGEEFLHF
ncbi:MAG: MBL fold metallo-hydrolase [Candidatus Hodarchaeales archaeon]|jgi:glyoxylase-like metal-dependent hydrolase (beta-lactamase superfamily II)